MPSFADNKSENAQSYSAKDGNAPLYAALMFCLAFFMPHVALVTTYSIAKAKIESVKGKKPKGYFQFWAAHLFILGFTIYTTNDN